MNYEKTKIYKIWSPHGDDIYIGSTTKDLLSQRMAIHRSHYKTWIKNGVKKGYISSFVLFAIDLASSTSDSFVNPSLNSASFNVSSALACLTNTFVKSIKLFLKTRRIFRNF
jgi:hypothetical protein